ncbi:histidine kinase [Clostridium sardiniense]|uniref:Histidine kinase n=1 Tax=Clostridium sardiniense TaxID=29369 RepID=A0ABS7KTX0_CLOSR|nr:histidine kinase [Clostridium sardiniense]MBY0754251.1 histidine kinase [Clostridium sardiniense]MDQ0461228.1 two-component system sensor histidine kinase YesM [Clostridium sardiniense]
MHKQNFRYKLFVNITVVVSIIIILTSMFYYFSTIANLNKSEQQGSKMVLESVSSQIDQLYNELDTALNSLIHNPQLKTTLQSLNSTDNKIPEIEQIHMKQIIENNLRSILFFPNISNVLLFNAKKDYFYYSGHYLKDNDYIKKELKKNDYLYSLKNNHSSIMLPPHRNQWNPSSSSVISIYKNFSGNTITKNTIIEVQASYKSLENICNHETFKNNKEIVIFDNNFNVIYPFNKDISVIKKNLIEDLKYNLEKGNANYSTSDYSYSSTYSDYTKLNIVLLSNNAHIKDQKFQFIISTIIFVSVILFTTLSIIFFITKKLSSPLQELIDYINKISLDKDTTLCIKNNNFDEFQVINESFNQMVIKLKSSMALAYESKISEVNANFTALQAQINPHFIYNTLNAISAASEIYGSEVTTKMCQELSFMMRYVTSNNYNVKLIDEINHVTNYLELMKISNGDNFNYKINIPIEAYDLIIPKLTIQPLVENCFKHAFKDSLPPWHIELICNVTKDGFLISIKDNGGGFKKSSLDDFNKFIKEYNLNESNNIYKDLKIGGLGLKNIHSRLSIFYKNNVELKIFNTDIGSEIIIKGMNEND